MSRQKRPIEEDTNENEETKTEEQSGVQGQTKDVFKCLCSKYYSKQSSLYNHIRIKHNNDKHHYVVQRYVRPGRPKHTEQNMKTTKAKRKEVRPENLDQNTWDLLQLYKDNLFQSLLIQFRDYMKTQLQTEKNVDQIYWQKYVSQRDALINKILPKSDIKEFVLRTDFILKRWGLLLDREYQVKLFLSFAIANVLKYYDLSQEKKDTLQRNQDMDIINKMIQLLNDDQTDVAEKYDIVEEVQEIEGQQEEVEDIVYADDDDDDQEEGQQEDQEQEIAQYSTAHNNHNNELQGNYQEDPSYQMNNQHNNQYDGQYDMQNNNNGHHHNNYDNNNTGLQGDQMNNNNEDDDDDFIPGEAVNQVNNSLHQPSNNQFFITPSILNRDSLRMPSFRNQQFYTSVYPNAFNQEDINFQSLQTHLLSYFPNNNQPQQDDFFQ